MLDPEFFRDPFPAYAACRAEGGVHQAVLPGGPTAWVLTRYEDARAALVDPRLSKDLSAAGALFERHTRGSTGGGGSSAPVIRHMLNSDPPDHTRLRRLVGRAFTAQRMSALRPVIERITGELLDVLAERHGVVDLIKEFAFPFATVVLSELLGVPEDDRDDFARWASAAVDGTGAAAPDPDQAGLRTLVGYLARLVAARRAEPGDDTLSLLVAANADADRLTDVELVMTALLLLVAGHDTMVGLIGNGVFALLGDPDQRAALLADPAVVPGAVEELLRFNGPVNFSTLRYTTAEVGIGGVTIPAGEFVVVALGSANHDPHRFTEPDRLDLRRPAGGHLAFGHGTHYCLGAPLARLAGEVAIPRLLARFPDLRLPADATEVTWLTSGLLRGMESLPVLLDRKDPTRKGDR
ncbi:cytochrome P450 [Actinosynnema sp. NPDC050801]|uniref:cytochrome P450 family protein n=1 Tax=unclassified Actinosynnema TaxID=2637065 RepID=UPI0034020956